MEMVYYGTFVFISTMAIITIISVAMTICACIWLRDRFYGG